MDKIPVAVDLMLWPERKSPKRTSRQPKPFFCWERLTRAECGQPRLFYYLNWYDQIKGSRLEEGLSFIEKEAKNRQLVAYALRQARNRLRARIKNIGQPVVKPTGFYMPADAWNTLPKRLRNVALLSTLFDWMSGWLAPSGADVDDWPDGAYEAIHCEAVDAFLQWYNDGSRLFPEVDWYDIQVAYPAWREQ